MADAKLTSTLLSHADMDVILKGVKAYIDAEITKAGGDTTAVANLLNALIGADDKAAELSGQKTVRTISAEEVAKVVANAPEAFDTLKEIADWIGSGDVANTTAAEMLTTIKANTQAIADEASRADAAEKANAKAISDEATRAGNAESALSGRLDVIEGEGAGSVKKAQADAEATAAADATEKVNALKDTAVSSTSTSGPATVTLGGTVGAPTVTVNVTMATEAEVKALTDLFAIEAGE